MPELGTATLKVDLDTTEAEATAEQFGTVLRSTSFGSRPPAVEALDFAIGSLATAAAQGSGTPASDEAIVKRADVFMEFFKRHGVPAAD